MNFSELSNAKSIIVSALSQMKGIKKSRIKFMLHIFDLFLGIKGRLNFLQFERYGKYGEQPYRNQFEEKFPFLDFNKSIIAGHASNHLAIAFDPSYISKSGKKTPGAGYFWSGVAGQAKWGLEIGGLAAVDIDNHTAFHLEAVQTIGLKEDETLLEYYTRIILDRMDSLQEVSKVLIADAYFSKRGFVESLFQNGFTVISRLRDDADLQYLYKGKQNKGRGRPRKYDGKVLVRALDPDKVTLENEQEREQIYSVVVAAKSLNLPAAGRNEYQSSYCQNQNERPLEP